MILNNSYYQSLWDKFQNVQTLTIESLGNSVDLSVKIILEHYRNNESIQINFQNSLESISEIAKQLFVELANDIYINHYDFPLLAIGNKLRDKRKHRDGKRHDWIVKSINNDTFKLEHSKNKAQSDFKYDNLLQNFIPIEQGTRQTTLQAYTKFFAKLNKGLSLEFTPTNFETKSVFISKKPLWDSIEIKNKIPCTYLPNPNDGNDIHPIKSIPALADCMIYFTPRYEICYQQLIQKAVKIKSIVIFDTEANMINQIMQDQLKYKFNVIVLSNSNTPTKTELIPFWNWFKEELTIIENL